MTSSSLVKKKIRDLVHHKREKREIQFDGEQQNTLAENRTESGTKTLPYPDNDRSPIVTKKSLSSGALGQEARESPTVPDLVRKNATPRVLTP